MIRLTSFYPFAGFRRVTQEFYEDKFVVKAKSITAKHEEEYTYDKVAVISDSYSSSGSQTLFGFMLLAIISIALVVLSTMITLSPILLRIAQGLYICGTLILVTGLFKHWNIFITDEDDKVLTNIKITNRNREMVYQVVDKVLGKSEKIQEISVADPFPETQPEFELTYYDYSRLEKTTDRFYESKIIGLQRSLLLEKVYCINYSTLNGKVFKGKLGIKVWEALFNLALLISSVVIGLNIGFDIISRKVVMYIVPALFILSALSWLLTLIRRDTVGLYDKNGRSAYWAYVNRADKEKFEKIIEFVQSRIPAENQDASLKEQA